MATSSIRAVCVFCGAASGDIPAYTEAAAELGNRLANCGIGLVYGGGGGGLMGAVADAALAAGGSVIGVIPRFLQERELAHQDLTELRIVSDMHQRKRVMFDLSDAFIALPGGLGTLDETLEIITWRQLQRHRKPVLILNTNNYWTPLLDLVDHVTQKEFAHGDMSALFRVVRNPEDALQFLSPAVKP